MDEMVEQESEPEVRWLIVEDESELISEFKEYGRLANAPEPVVACCVDDAIDCVKSWGGGRTLAFIDMMIPKSTSHLQKLNGLAAQRLEIIQQSAEEYISSVASDHGTTRANTRQKLREIDETSRSLVNMNGGMDVLKSLDVIRELQGEWEIYVFSARSRPAEWDNFSREVDQHSSHRIRWAQKPIDPARVVSILSGFFGDKK